MTITNYADLKALAESVGLLNKSRTAGTWIIEDNQVYCVDFSTPAREIVICDAHQKAADAQFICNAPDMASALQFAVQEIERLQKDNKKLRKNLRGIRNHKTPTFADLYKWRHRFALQPNGDK